MTQQAQTAPGVQSGAETRDAGTLAVLIDADNAQAELLGAVLAEAAKFGTVAVRRIYGDWTSSHMAGWKHPAQIHAVQPVQQFNHAAGKNSTDMALAIDAMDLLGAYMPSLVLGDTVRSVGRRPEPSTGTLKGCGRRVCH